MIKVESYLIYFEFFLDKIQSSIIDIISTLKQNSLNTKLNRECHYKLKIYKIQSSITNVTASGSIHQIQTLERKPYEIMRI